MWGYLITQDYFFYKSSMNTLNYNNMTLDEISVALQLDEQERALMESIKNDEWVSVSNVEE